MTLALGFQWTKKAVGAVGAAEISAAAQRANPRGREEKNRSRLRLRSWRLHARPAPAPAPNAPPFPAADG